MAKVDYLLTDNVFLDVDAESAIAVSDVTDEHTYSSNYYRPTGTSLMLTFC